MVDNTQDVIDSREVIERIAEIETEAQGRFLDAHPEGVSYGELADLDHAAYLDESDADELAALREMAAEASDYASDWEYGETLVRDSYFTEYAQQLAEDSGMTLSDPQWPYTCIDWDWAARELKHDYTSVDFDGVTYWVRAS